MLVIGFPLTPTLLALRLLIPWLDNAFISLKSARDPLLDVTQSIARRCLRNEGMRLSRN